MHPHSHFRAALPGILIALAVILYMCALGALLSTPAHAAVRTPTIHTARTAPVKLRHDRIPGARAVALTDATAAPDYLRIVRPARTRCLPRRLVWGGTEVSAYRWDGRALGAQHAGRLRTTHTHGQYWLVPGTRDRVEFDGACFHNETLRPVLVAVWIA